MGYWIAVHETRGTAITTSDEPGMCSQHYKIIQSWIFRVLSQGESTCHSWSAKRWSSTPWNSVIKLGPQKRVQALVCMERVHWEPLGHELCRLQGFQTSCASGPVSSSRASSWKRGHVSAGQGCAVLWVSNGQTGSDLGVKLGLS